MAFVLRGCGSLLHTVHPAPLCPCYTCSPNLSPEGRWYPSGGQPPCQPKCGCLGSRCNWEPLLPGGMCPADRDWLSHLSSRTRIDGGSRDCAELASVPEVTVSQGDPRETASRPPPGVVPQSPLAPHKPWAAGPSLPLSICSLFNPIGNAYFVEGLCENLISTLQKSQVL